MTETKNNREKNTIKKEQIEATTIIAYSAVMATKGVSSLGTVTSQEIAESLGIKVPSRGIKVEINEDGITVNVFVNVEYESRIPEVAWRIQENVKLEVEKEIDLKVEEVNVHVQGIKFE